MITLFFLVSHSTFITGKEAEHIFDKDGHKPIFVSLTSQWCPHCMEYKPIKKKLENYFQDNKEVELREINCDQERELCARFAGSGTPRIYMVTTSVEEAKIYEGSRTFEELKAFIRKYTLPPIAQLNNEAQFKLAVKQNMDSSIFILQDLNRTKLSRIIGKLAPKMSMYPCLFYNLTYRKIETVSPIFYNYFYHTNRMLNYSRNINEKGIENFIYEHIYPPLSTASSYFFDIQMKLKEPYFVVDDMKHVYYNKLLKMTVSFPENLKSIEINCNLYDKFCRSIKFDPRKSPNIAIVNSHRNTFFEYSGNLSQEEIVKWVNSVWNGNEKEQGPGAGLKGFFRREIRSRVTDYRWWLKFLASFIICVLVLYVLCKVVQLYHINQTKTD